MTRKLLLSLALIPCFTQSSLAQSTRAPEQVAAELTGGVDVLNPDNVSAEFLDYVASWLKPKGAPKPTTGHAAP